jgi:hypothetical protein
MVGGVEGGSHSSVVVGGKKRNEGDVMKKGIRTRL